jgi:molecular chaperone GrpE
MSKKKDQEEVSEGAQNVSGAASTQNAGEASLKGSDPPAAAGKGADPCASAEDRITALEAEVADLKDKLLRKQADFENFRKRMIREREEASRYANAALLTDIIGLIDDFERAIRSAEESRDFPSFLQGVSMIEKQFVEMLESRWGLKRFSSLGEGFDPNRHEAVLRVEGPADAKPTVVEDYQKGYYLHERVLRPARVKVMVPAAGPAQTRDTDPRDGNDETARTDS